MKYYALKFRSEAEEKEAFYALYRLGLIRREIVDVEKAWKRREKGTAIFILALSSIEMGYGYTCDIPYLIMCNSVKHLCDCVKRLKKA